MTIVLTPLETNAFDDKFHTFTMYDLYSTISNELFFQECFRITKKSGENIS